MWTTSSPYAAFLDRLEDRMRGAPARRPPPGAHAALPGLFPLVASFSTTAPVQGASPVMEWNPFYQRLFYRTDIRGDAGALLVDLASAALAVDRFIEVAHEAMHVLFWEPFFAGRARLDRARFVELNLLSEAQCFWYADIVVTRALRVKLADGELVRGRSAVSQPLFHPYRAFATLGIEDDDAILEHYLDAFAGDRGLLYRHRHRTLARTLFEQFAKMYLMSKDACGALEGELAGIGVFDEFARRFASGPGLPSLLPDDLDLGGDPRAYCRALGREGLRHIAGLSPSAVARVRMRRHIQTRAYAAYALSAALRGDQVLSRKRLRTRALLADLDGYLARLEASLGHLAAGARPDTVRRRCAADDAWYSATVRDPLAQADAWMRRRNRIVPAAGAIGLLDGAAPAAVEATARTALDAAHRALARGHDAAVARRTAAVLTSKPGSAAWCAAIDALLRERAVLEQWSVPLAAIDPEHERFRELQFVLV